MAAVAKKCYYSNTSKIILFDFYSSCANRKSQVFSADLLKTSTLVHDHFLLLTPEDKHAASPRLIGNVITYFDNCLSTSDGYLIPGPQEKSRKILILHQLRTRARYVRAIFARDSASQRH